MLAQRLVRRLCDNCCVDYQPSRQEASWIRHTLGSEVPEQYVLKQASGCHRCNNTGYRGRIGVFELLVLNDDMADALRRSNSSDFVRAARASKGYRPLVVSAMMEAFSGVTSLDEVYRVAEQLDESGEWSVHDESPDEREKADALASDDMHLMDWKE